MITHLVDIFFHLEEWLQQIATFHPLATYSLFFAIVFMESAFFPYAPFLPGDGLLFTVGILAGSGSVNLSLSIGVLIVGGVAGTWVAYRTGKWLGPTIFDRFNWLNRSHYQRAHEFYQQYGYKALLFSRFIPVVRAMVPFVAGITVMNQRQFIISTVISVSAWVMIIVLGAYFLGNIPFIKQHFTWVIFGMAVASVLPAIWFGLRKVLFKPTYPAQ